MKGKFSGVTIVIPCMNEASLILNSISRIDNVISARYAETNYEIVIVDDGSSDDISGSLLLIEPEKFVSQFTLKLLSLSENVGKDLAIVSSVPQIANESDLVVIVDADGEHPFDLIPEFHDKMRSQEETEQIVGLRHGSNAPQLWRKLGGWIYSRMTDRAQNGVVETDFRIVRKDLLERIYQLEEKKVHLQTSFARLTPVTEFIEFKVSSTLFEKPSLRKSRWGFMKLFEYASISLMKSDNKVSKLLLFSFLLNLVIGTVLISLVLIGTVLNGTRNGTLTILLVNSLFFMSNSFFLFVITTYLRLIYIEVQNSPRFKIQGVRKIL
jgi:glycosyltransferase involved in cell wall biosynthesis